MSNKFPVELADLCVKCGLCAPHCPTYSLDHIEPESPRGRIAMMSAIATGQLQPSAIAQSHLDHCLGCRACEAVCPAKVPYLDLLDAHRADMQSATAAEHTFAARWLTRLSQVRTGRALLRGLLFVLAHVRPALLRVSQRLPWPSLHRLLSLAPTQVLMRLPARREPAAVQLFVGCMGDMANAAAIRAFVAVCARLGITVDTLPTGLCCGALEQHQGRPEHAQDQRRQTLTFRKPGVPLVAMDSACASQLRDAGWDHVQEACAFLDAQDWSAVTLTPTDETLLIHEPCTHRNGLRQKDAARRLLQRIPDLQFEAMQDTLCCGAAGAHMLEFPERADALLAPKLNQCMSSPASQLGTTNIGCALHIAGGLRRASLQPGAGLPTVCHPIELLARQIHATNA